MKLTRRSILLWAMLGTSLACLQTEVHAAAVINDITVELPSGKRFYRDSGGSGVAVVFLHSAWGNSMLWEYQIPAFTAAGYRFIAINFRPVPRAAPGAVAEGPPSPHINELMAKLGIERFHLVGTAAGGGIALQYALANPGKLRSITIANSIGGVQDNEYADMGRRIRPPQFNQLPLEFRELGPSYRAANPDGVKRWLTLSGEGSGAPAPGGAAPGGPPAPAGPPGGIGNSPHAVTWAKLEAFRVPTLLLTGDADLYTPPSVLRMFTARMKHAESAVIAESGHSSYWENPETFNRTVLAFIGKH